MLQIFIGYDPKEAVAYHTLAHSILRRSSIPVSIAPLMRSQLKGLYTRARGSTESTEFSLTRFLVPALSQYRGWSLFMDCDMLIRADIAELAAFTERAADKSVLVCKHDYVPKTARKMLDQVQTRYARKNWSSVILWNCRFGENKCLTPDYIGGQSGAHLHRFEWLKDEHIGELPSEWNHLTMEFSRNDAAKLLHYTIGIPAFPEYAEQEGAQEWREHLRAAAQPLPMG